MRLYIPDCDFMYAVLCAIFRFMQSYVDNDFNNNDKEIVHK